MSTQPSRNEVPLRSLGDVAGIGSAYGLPRALEDPGVSQSCQCQFFAEQYGHPWVGSITEPVTRSRCRLPPEPDDARRKFGISSSAPP